MDPMVKRKARPLADGPTSSRPPVIEHVGIALWRAAAAWRRQFRREMVDLGYHWHAEARGDLLSHIGPAGRSQSGLVAAMGLSKQAVHQLVDQLVADGVLRRVPHPADKRAKRVELTPLGLDDFRQRTRIKRKIENCYNRQLGPARFDALIEMLTEIAGNPQGVEKG
jgi:MarR family transcriptional regulator, transcriptional regulator for hemolysin